MRSVSAVQVSAAAARGLTHSLLLVTMSIPSRWARQQYCSLPSPTRIRVVAVRERSPPAARARYALTRSIPWWTSAIVRASTPAPTTKYIPRGSGGVAAGVLPSGLRTVICQKTP